MAAGPRNFICAKAARIGSHREMLFALALITFLATTASAAQKQEFRYAVGPGASITVVNDFGPVTLKPSPGNQVLVTASVASKKVEVDCNQAGNRIDVRTHFLDRNTTPDDGRVDYEIQVPADANVTVRAGTGAIRAEKLRGDITLEGDGSSIDLRDIANSMVHARTVSGPITLTNVTNGHLELTTVSGNVILTNVTGPKVTVNSTKGALRYEGNFGGGGDYSLTNHSGDIDVMLADGASVDLTARSVNGNVQNEYPFQPKAHTTFQVTQGHSFAGTANSGASMVHLRSFSGTIRVKKK